MRKSFIFIMVGLAYVVIAMAASWANTSNALDKTLAIIGLSQEAETSTIQQISDELKPMSDNTKGEKEQQKTNILKNSSNLLAYYVPVPPPGNPGTDPKD